MKTFITNTDLEQTNDQSIPGPIKYTQKGKTEIQKEKCNMYVPHIIFYTQIRNITIQKKIIHH